MKLVKNIGELLTLEPAAQKQGRKILEKDLGIVSKAAFVVSKGRIAWIGPAKKLPRQFAQAVRSEVDMEGRTVLPGFIECHTHTVFAGNRSAEFELRNQGVSYQEITARGGGILSTVQQTRKASPVKLLKDTQEKVNAFVAQGVTTLEIKSGYALNLKDELKMLEVAGKVQGPLVVRTFLGAHSMPPEFSSKEDYIEFLIHKVLPQVAKKKLAQRVDIFIEKGFFTPEQGSLLLVAAQKLGLSSVVHADQLSLSGGTALAVELGALSADHVLQVQDSEIKALSKSEVTAVLLPAADLYMKVSYPPARKLIDAGARVALATDFNPGTSPTQDLNLVGLLARLEMKMTLPEVIAAYTVGASYALGLSRDLGSLELGKSADFLGINGDWSSLFYSVGERSCNSVFRAGKRIF